MASDQDPSEPGDGAPPGDSSGRMNPELSNFVSDQNTPMGQAWAGIAAQRAQSYLTARSNAIDAQQAADQVVTNLHQAKTGLVGMVQNDPGSMDLALDLAQHSVNGIVDQHGHLDEDARQTAANSITDHMQSEIVHGGIQSLAENDKGAALKALDRYGDYLPDDQQGRAAPIRRRAGRLARAGCGGPAGAAAAGCVGRRLPRGHHLHGRARRPGYRRFPRAAELPIAARR